MISRFFSQIRTTANETIQERNKLQAEKTENEVSCNIYGCSLNLVLSFSKFSFHFAYSLTKLFLNNVKFTIAILFTSMFDIFFCLYGCVLWSTNSTATDARLFLVISLLCCYGKREIIFSFS